MLGPTANQGLTSALAFVTMLTEVTQWATVHSLRDTDVVHRLEPSHGDPERAQEASGAKQGAEVGRGNAGDDTNVKQQV